MGPERYRAPECLFHPEQMGSECMGVHDCLLKGIMRTDMDMRRTLFGQVVLSGGSTLFPGFGDRLLNEVGHFCSVTSHSCTYLLVSGLRCLPTASDTSVFASADDADVVLCDGWGTRDDKEDATDAEVFTIVLPVRV